MPDDLSQYFITAGILSAGTLKRAQYFLRLAERASTEEDRGSLAGAAIILAIAHLSQGVEFGLLQALANAAVEDGRRPSKPELQEQLPGGLTARMRRLATVLGGSRLHLDETQPATVRLISAIRLRNRLIHEAREHVMGSLADIDSSLVGSVLTIRLQIPEDPWQEVTLELARFVVDASESYFEDLERVVQNASFSRSTFFRRSLYRGQ